MQTSRYIIYIYSRHIPPDHLLSVIYLESSFLASSPYIIYSVSRFILHIALICMHQRITVCSFFSLSLSPIYTQTDNASLCSIPRNFMVIRLSDRIYIYTCITGHFNITVCYCFRNTKKYISSGHVYIWNNLSVKNSPSYIYNPVPPGWYTVHKSNSTTTPVSARSTPPLYQLSPISLCARVQGNEKKKKRKKGLYSLSLLLLHTHKWSVKRPNYRYRSSDRHFAIAAGPLIFTRVSGGAAANARDIFPYLPHAAAYLMEATRERTLPLSPWNKHAREQRIVKSRRTVLRVCMCECEWRIVKGEAGSPIRRSWREREREWRKKSGEERERATRANTFVYELVKVYRRGLLYTLAIFGNFINVISFSLARAPISSPVEPRSVYIYHSLDLWRVIFFFIFFYSSVVY